MEQVLRDVRYALAALRRAPALTLTVLATLGLGIGAATAVFSVVHGVLLRPLPFPDSQQLVRVWEEHPGGRTLAGNRWLTLRTRRAWTERARTIENIAAYGATDYTVRVGSEPVRLHGSFVSPAAFGLLRASPALGRFFTVDEDRSGGARVVVLSHRFWREQYGGDATIVGRTMVIDGEPRTIVGIARPELVFPNPRVLFWIPFAIPADADAATRTVVFTALARLRPGATSAQAEAEATAAARSTPRPASTEFFFGKGEAVVVHARSLADDMSLPVRPALAVVAAAVGLVLLITCANVANLLLSRGATRHRELAIRSALGGSRTRLVGQLMAESALLSVASGALGLGLAWSLVRVLPLLAPERMPRLEDVTVDGAVIAFGLGASLTTAMVSGLMPALRSTKIDLFQAFRGGEGSSTASASAIGSRRLRIGLVIVEAAFAVVLTVGASLLAHSFLRLTQVDAGYDANRVLTFRALLPDGPNLDVRTTSLIDRALARIRSTPGVIAAGAGNMMPLTPMTAITGITLPPSVGGGKPTTGRVLSYVVTPGYAEALRLRLLGGRLLTEEDATSGVRAVIVNEEFVRRFLADRHAVGVRLGSLYEGTYGKETEIVGVIGNVLKDGHDAERQPEMYFAHGSPTHRIVGFPSFVVRTAGDDPSLAATLRRYVREIDPSAAIDRQASLRSFVAASWDQPRFAASIVSGFALLAMGLAGMGLYAALSYNVSQRRREMGVRAALGATRPNLVALVLREGLTVTLVGVGLGIVAASVLTRLMVRLLFGTSPLDPISFTVGPALLVLIGIAASVLPALRAASADPATVLRGD